MLRNAHIMYTSIPMEARITAIMAFLTVLLAISAETLSTLSMVTEDVSPKDASRAFSIASLSPSSSTLVLTKT